MFKLLGHNLDLAINKGLKDSRIDQVLGLCRKIIASFSYSWKRQRFKGNSAAKGFSYLISYGDIKLKYRTIFKILIPLNTTTMYVQHLCRYDHTHW